MRTMHTLTSGVKEKVEYYEEDESLVDAQERYYGEAETVSAVDRMSQAVWSGTAAKREGLTGVIVREDFKAVLRGKLPHTDERIRWDNPNPDTKERLAHDVVLSAPKSISMALHLEGDLRIFDAHTEAVQATLDLIEQEVAQTRIQVNGVRSVVFTGNLIAALIPHHTSRDGDMQLHTHMLIMNGTQGPDGVWRSLSHESLASAEWVGSYYRQKLAENVQALGYRIEITQDSFELAGYDRDEIEVFSKRNRAIVQSVMDQGLEINPQTKKAAVLPTRKAKSKVGQKLEIIQEQWQQEARDAGIGHPIQAEPTTAQSSSSIGQFEVDSAIRHLSETAVSFSRSEIYAYAFKHIHTAGLEIDHLNAAIAHRNNLIAVGNGRMTTVDALEREIATIQNWTLGQGKVKPILDAETARNFLSGTSLNPGQYEAVLSVGCSTDQHLIIQGLAGVGKTHALGALKHLIEASDEDFAIRGFSPTLKAAQQLQQEMGIATHTVESLVRQEADVTPNQLWIIDEAGMVSADQMLTLVEKANSVGARILLVGDTGQNPSVKAGSPMKSLMQNGATTFRLSDIIRQQNSMQKRAVELIANGQPVEALSILSENGYVQAMPSQTERVQAIAQDYLSLNRIERSKTLIVTGTNSERNAITQAIRAGLKSEGSLGQETTILRLSSQYLSVEEKRRVENFETGSYIQLLRNYQSTPLQHNQLYQVMGREGEELIVSSPGGRLYRFDPSLYADKEVFKAERFAVAVGDHLRWTASNRKEGQINGSEFTVIGVTDKTLIVADDKGTKIVTLNQPISVDYALVSTSYRAQGQTAKRVIVSATSGPTAAKEPFYVKISRQTHEIKIYAEDPDHLKDWVQRTMAQANPLELIEATYGNDRTNDRVERDRLYPERLARDERPKPGIAEDTPQRDGSDSHDLAAGTGELSRAVHPSVREPGTLPDCRSDSGVDGGIEKPKTTIDGLGANDHRNEFSDPVHRRGDSELRPPTIPSTTPEIGAIPDLEQPSHLYRGMEQAANAIALVKDETEALKILEATHALVQDLKRQVEVTIQQAKAEVVRQAIQTWKTTQRSPHLYNGMETMAQNVADYKAEEAIAQHLSEFKAMATQFTQQVQNRPELQRLAETVKLLRETLTVTDEKLSEKLQQIAEGLRGQGLSATPKPQKPEPFWNPHYPAEVPSHIQPAHWTEFQRSAIHPELIALNAESVSGQAVYERLLSERLSQLGSGQYVTQPMARLMEQYEQVAEGGWWGKAGIDANSLANLQPGQVPELNNWGCFKPDRPRIDPIKTERKGHPEFVKYEHPLKTSRSLYLPLMPDHLAEQIYRKHQIEPSAAQKQSGFWSVVLEYNLPITLTEGVKKTWASLSQGEVTIGVSGVNGVYRAKDPDGNSFPERQLDPELALFATPGREFRFAYDNDSNPATASNVRRDLVRGIELLEAKGCTCKVIQWEGDKGLDDLIVNQGPMAYARAQKSAIPAQAITQDYYRHQYEALAERIRSERPSISTGRLDMEIYRQAVQRGDRRDGDRVIGEGDRVRDLKARSENLAKIYVGRVRDLMHQYQTRWLKKPIKNLDEEIEKMLNTGLHPIEGHRSTSLHQTQNQHRGRRR